MRLISTKLTGAVWCQLECRYPFNNAKESRSRFDCTVEGEFGSISLPSSISDARLVCLIPYASTCNSAATLLLPAPAGRSCSNTISSLPCWCSRWNFAETHLNEGLTLRRCIDTSCWAPCFVCFCFWNLSSTFQSLVGALISFHWNYLFLSVGEKK